MSTGFQPTGYNIYGKPSESTPIAIPITNSATVVKGSPVSVTTGFVSATVATNVVKGICVGFVDKYGLPISKYGSESKLGGTYTPGGYGVESYAAASDNQTVDKVCALVNIDIDEVYKVVADANLGTTTGSDLMFYHADTVAAPGLQIDETTTVAGTAQFTIVGFDPNVTNGLLVKICENQV